TATFFVHHFPLIAGSEPAAGPWVGGELYRLRIQMKGPTPRARKDIPATTQEINSPMSRGLLTAAYRVNAPISASHQPQQTVQRTTIFAVSSGRFIAVPF